MHAINEITGKQPSGGIQLWATHPLLSGPQLPTILKQIDPEHTDSLQPILAWGDQPEMRSSWGALIRLVASKIPSDAPMSASEKGMLVQAKIKQSVSAFSMAREEFDEHGSWHGTTNSTSHSITNSVQAYVKELIQAVSGNAFALREESGQKLFQTISWFLFLQDVADNPRYTPHDYRHALVVARWMADIAQKEPAVLNSLIERYQCSKAQALALLQLAGLMHDCGYPFMADRVECSGEALQQQTHPALTKATHAPVGGMMFHVMVKPVLSQLLADSGVNAGAAVCHEMVRAIHLHSSDDPSSTNEDVTQISTQGGGIYQVRDEAQLLAVSAQLNMLGDPVTRVKLYQPTDNQVAHLRKILPADVRITHTAKPLPPGRAIDWQCIGDRGLMTPCVKVDRQHIPMAYMVMLADNLDMTCARLGNVQGSSVYGRALLQFHSVEALQSDLNALGKAVRDFYDHRTEYSDQDKWPALPEAVIVDVCASSKQDIDFLAGLLSVAKVVLETGEPADKIIVQLQPLPAWFKEQDISMEAVEKQMRFHVDRLEHALSFLVDAPNVEVRWPHRLFAEPSHPEAQLARAAN
jgi:hypothetical protein